MGPVLKARFDKEMDAREYVELLRCNHKKSEENRNFLIDNGKNWDYYKLKKKERALKIIRLSGGRLYKLISVICGFINKFAENRDLF